MITESPDESDNDLMARELRAKANLPAMLEAVEEDLGNLLPAGWSVHIKAWRGETP